MPAKIILVINDKLEKIVLIIVQKPSLPTHKSCKVAIRRSKPSEQTGFSVFRENSGFGVHRRSYWLVGTYASSPFVRIWRQRSLFRFSRDFKRFFTLLWKPFLDITRKHYQPRRYMFNYFKRITREAIQNVTSKDISVSHEINNFYLEFDFRGRIPL